jgi:PhzF family phenazine biosynthesis protein
MINNKRIFQIDAFTDEPFKGNPAGVMIVDSQVSAEWMQHMALEMNLSETAFLIPNENGFTIRFFTPTKEVPLCGHATLAAAHLVYELGLKSKDESISFKAMETDLTITKEGDLIVMNFPRYPLQKIEVMESFNSCIGFQPIEMYSSSYGWIIAIAGSEEEIIKAQPNFETMVQHGLGHLMITAQVNNKSADFVVRCFAPISGINEDPVTGSAHCALTPLWADKLGKTELESLQVSQRTGSLKLKLKEDRVEIKGKAVTIFEAQLTI